MRTLREVRVWSPNERAGDARSSTRRSQTARRAASRAAASAREAVDGADLVVLVTASRERRWSGTSGSRQGAHVVRGRRVPAGSAGDGFRAGRAARLFVDSRAAALAESGDIVIPMAEGRVRARRTSPASSAKLAAGAVPGRESPERGDDLQVARDGGRGRGGRAPRLRTGGGARPRPGDSQSLRLCGARPSASSSSRRSASGLPPTSAAVAGGGPHAVRRRRSPSTTHARPIVARSFAALAVSAASRSRVCAISRSSPPSAQPISSADLTSTVLAVLSRSPFGHLSSVRAVMPTARGTDLRAGCYHSPMISRAPLPRSPR